MSDDDRPPEITPWGHKQEDWEDGAGFWWVSTSGHGGIYLKPEQSGAIPENLKHYSADDEGKWWEEDCAWALPVVCLFSKRPEGSLSDEEEYLLERAHPIARNYYPDEWENLTGRKIEPGESHQRDADNALIALRDNLVVSSVWGSSRFNPWIPEGMVCVSAYPGKAFLGAGDFPGVRRDPGQANDEARYFLVSEKGYKDDERDFFVVDPARHQEITDRKPKPQTYEPSNEEMQLAELAIKYRDRLIEQAKELEQTYKDPATSDQHKERINSYLNLRERHADHYRELIRNNDPEIRKPGIIDADHRYGRESASHFHFEIAFESLAATDRADFGTFNAQQKYRGEMIAIEQDAKGQEILKTKKLIEAYEYLARAARHISIQSKEITGRPDNPESVSMVRAAQGTSDSPGFLSHASELRQHFKELQTERVAEQQPHAQSQNAEERPKDRLDRLVEEQDQLQRAKEGPVHTGRPRGRGRGR
jgi:hypothetical protein